MDERNSRDLWAMFFLEGCCVSFVGVFAQFISSFVMAGMMLILGILAIILVVFQPPENEYERPD